jgi:hypothetical protein
MPLLSSIYFHKSFTTLGRRCPGYPSCSRMSRPERRTLLGITPSHLHSFNPHQSLRCNITSITQSHKHHSLTSSLGPIATSPKETLSRSSPATASTKRSCAAVSRHLPQPRAVKGSFLECAGMTTQQHPTRQSRNPSLLESLSDEGSKSLDRSSKE